MADDSEAERLLGLVRYYERVLGDMQEGVFFAQDSDGVLRRWRPKRVLSKDGQRVGDDQ